MKFSKFLSVTLLFLVIITEYIISASSVNLFNYKQLEDEDNFIGQSVFKIEMDNDGFVWIASRSGVSRYDGRNIKQYPLTDSEISVDGDGRQTSIRKMYNNQLWAFTDSGKIFYYDKLSDTFILFDNIAETEQSVIVNDLYLDDKNRLWIGATRGLFCYNILDETRKRVVYNSGTYINCIIPFSEHEILTGTSNGLQFIDISNNGKETSVLCEKNNIMSVSYDKERNYLWIGTFSAGLYVWDITNKIFINSEFIRSVPHIPIKAIKRWNNNNMLIGLDGRGVYKIDVQKQTAEPFLSNEDSHNGILRGNGVYDILVDNKNIWVGTYSGGVTIVQESDVFNWIRHIPYDQQSLGSNHVYAMLEDRDGDIWYATNIGVSFYDIRARKWKHFLEKENSFLTLCEDKNGRIWTGGYSTGLYCIDKKKGVERYIRSLEGNAQLDCIYATLKDEDGDLWFGGLYSSLTRISYDNGNEKLTHYKKINRVKSIVSVNNDTLFVGTSNGFYLLDRHTGEFQHMFGTPSRYNVKSNSFIYPALVLGNEIWFGTDGGGLNCFNIRSKEVINFSTYNGLPSNYIYGIIKDENNSRLWVSSSNGLFCMDSEEKKFLFNVDNLPIKEFLFMSFTRFNDGRIAFGGTNGAIVINTRNLSKPDLKADLHFTDFRLSYKTVTTKDNPELLPKSVDNVEEIVLKHNQNSFSFGFVAIDLYNPESYVYNYRLVGFDNSWVSRGNSNTADYTNIPPGKYRFVVRCISRNGGQILSEREIDVVVKQPFWNTIWAWCVYLLIAGVIVYWLWRFYQERIEKQQSEERINFFINVAHDIRTPLSLILAPLNNLDEEKGLTESGRNYLKLAVQNGEKLFSLVTQLLDFQKEKNSPSELSVSLFNLKDYLSNRVDHFETLAHAKSIYLQLEMPDEEVFIETDIKKMDRIIDNLLSNAIKYTGVNGRVQVRLKKTDKKVTIEVEDNGIGISKSEQKKIFKQFYRSQNAINSKETGSGIGLVFTRKLVKLLDGDLIFSSKENEGTVFLLTLPVKNSQYNFAANEVDNEAVLIETAENINLPVSGKRHFAESYRILLVEDNDDMRSYLANVLSEEYKLHSVPSAEDALEFLKKHTVDLVLSDIMMPGMQGDELCKILKQNIETSHVQVILLTAYSEKDKMMSSMECGADDFITKPFDLKLLKMKIHNYLQTRKKLQQHYMTVTNLQELAKEQDTEKADEVIAINNIDTDFLNKCIKIVSDNISNTGFTINDLCREMAMSRTLIYEKLRALTNQPPNEFIRMIRLKRAKELLSLQKYTINEVAEMTGFSDTKYFSTVFKKYYGYSPSKIN